MEKVRRLHLLLQTGIQEYDEAVKALQSERLKYLRLAMTDSFGTDDHSSRTSWLAHLQALETGLGTRLDALRQAIINTTIDIQNDLNRKTPRATPPTTSPNRTAADADASDEPETPSDADKV